MSKSFTTIEQKMCKVTGKPYDSGALLLDKHMREKFDMHTVTGWGFSPEVEEKFKDGYVALVGIDEDKSVKLDNGNISPKDAYRTGKIAYLKAHLFSKIFNVEPKDNLVFVEDGPFVDQSVFEYLEEIQVKE